jgi:hypothetical protein
MRAIARPLTLALVVAMVSCSGGGSALPVIHDYTNAGTPAVSPKPQSVIPPYQPCSGPTCTGHGCSPGDDSAGKTLTPDCVTGPLPGYNTLGEQTCNAGGGIYLSLQNVPASSGQVSCAIGGILPIVSDPSPNGCPSAVTVAWNASGSGTIFVGAVTASPGIGTIEYTASKGIRVSLACTYFIDGVNEGALLATRHP